MSKRIGLYGTSIYYLMVWTVFQEFVLGILYHFVHITPLIKVLFFSKDVMMVLLYFIALFKNNIPQRFFLLQMGYILLVLIGTMTSLMTNRVSTMTAISATRGLMLLPAFLTIGYSISNTDAFFDIIKTRYMKLMLVAALFGILDYVLDYVIGTKSFWRDFVQLGQYMSDIKDQAEVLSGGLPGNFYTYSTLGIFTQKRLVSFWAGPLTAGYCLLIPFVYFFYNVVLHNESRNVGARNTFIKCIIVGIAVLLTFTRGIILPLVGFIVFCFIYKYRRDGGRMFLFLSILLLFSIVILTVYWDKVFGYVYNGSTLAHIESVNGAVQEVSFLGRGAGTFAAATTEGVWTESGYISIAGQLGILAVALYIILFIYPIRRIIKSKIVFSEFVLAIGLSGIIYMITGIFSAQLNAYTSMVPYYILAGAAMKNVITNKRKAEKNKG